MRKGERRRERVAMASERQRETISLGKRRPEAGSRVEDEAEVVENEEEDENGDIQELEREVSEMGRRILDARRSIPDRLLEALSSSLLTQRPVLPPQALIGTDAGTTELQAPSSESNWGNVLANADQRLLEKLLVLRAKTETNISTMPVILKRINDCIVKIEELEKCHVNVHPVFNKK
ncbi:hypothetical protein MUK42_21191 [Musa troglodytarum]|uniref:Uncharacterized protein n=1 Tax=Musa troglodytarum TaxID=320322 RepID=A0A9E7G173_9LILI|nr:hypothetical protein MUK42_21191 [Musa troglodytarum]